RAAPAAAVRDGGACRRGRARPEPLSGAAWAEDRAIAADAPAGSTARNDRTPPRTLVGRITQRRPANARACKEKRDEDAVCSCPPVDEKAEARRACAAEHAPRQSRVGNRGGAGNNCRRCPRPTAGERSGPAALSLEAGLRHQDPRLRAGSEAAPTW